MNADSNKFKLSATNGGAAINITAATGTAVAANHRYVKAPTNTSVGGLDPNRHYYVQSVAGDNITLAATQTGAALNLTAASNASNHTFQYKKPDFSDIEISYDMANQSFRFNQTDDTKVDKLWISTGNLSGTNNAVLGVGQADFANGTLGTF